MKQRLPACIAVLCAASTVALAQNATTVPVGAITLNFPATSQTTSTVISIPLSNAPVFSGIVASVGNNTLTIENASFSHNQFVGAGNPNFLRITKGNQEGRTMLIVSHTSNQLTLDTTDNNLPVQAAGLDIAGAAVVPGDTIQIIPGDTLSGIFGDNTPDNPLIFTGANGVLSADTIGIYNKSLNKNDAYFFSTSLGHWRSLTSTASANNLVIFPENAIIVTRRANRPAKTLTILGEVPATKQFTRIVGNNAGMWTSTKVPVDLTLSQFALNGWKKANSLLSADTIGIYNPNTGLNDAYYQRLDNSWRKFGDNVTDYSNVNIPAGSGLFILRRGTVSGTQSFLTYNLPYSLN